MYWKLEVLEYGKIEKAEIEIAPLTLFVGDNNSGKSYLLSLLWGIQNFGVETLLRYKENEDLTEEYALTDWIRGQLLTAWDSGCCICKVNEVTDVLQSVLDKGLKRNKEYLVQRIFNSPNVKIQDLKIRLKDLADFSFTITRGSEADGQKDMLRIGNDYTAGYCLRFSKIILKEMEQTVNWFLIDIIYGMLLRINIFDESSVNSKVYFPSSRTGFMLTKDIINKVGRNAVFNMELEQEKITPFSRPVNQFLDVMNDLTTDSKGEERYNKIIQYLENGMAEGTIQMRTLPNKEVSYVPAGQTEGIPLRIVSAVVTELSPLILILKHKEYLNTLFYEEPEMCLHPQLQQKMAKVICRLVNNQLDMAVTTHSDIILQHINNMIRLSSREDKDEICSELDYTSGDLLTANQIKVYQLKSKPEGMTAVEELVCGKNGFAIPTFNDALDKIMDEAYKIQE